MLSPGGERELALTGKPGEAWVYVSVPVRICERLQRKNCATWVGPFFGKLGGDVGD